MTCTQSQPTKPQWSWRSLLTITMSFRLRAWVKVALGKEVNPSIFTNLVSPVFVFPFVTPFIGFWWWFSHPRNTEIISYFSPPSTDNRLFPLFSCTTVELPTFLKIHIPTTIHLCQPLIVHCWQPSKAACETAVRFLSPLIKLKSCFAFFFFF